MVVSRIRGFDATVQTLTRASNCNLGAFTLANSKSLINVSKLTRFVLVFAVCGLLSESLRGQDVADKTDPSGFGRLAEPKVADAVRLTDEQRAQIAAVIAKRSEAISKAASAERPQILDEVDKELAAILTDEQKLLFAKATAEPRLRFNFRFQKWADVLDWLANGPFPRPRCSSSRHV